MNPVTFFNLHSNDSLRILVNAFVERVIADGGTVNDVQQLLLDLRTTRFRNKIKLGYFPNAIKSGKTYSIFPNTAAGDFTFTRSGNAWRVDETGNWVQNSTNIPRIDYQTGRNSLFFERTRPNRLLHSQAFNNAVWVKSGVTVTDNYLLSPSNATNATLLQGVGTIRQTGNFQNTPNNFDVFIKRISGSGTVKIKCGQAEKEINPTSEWQRYDVIGVGIGATYTSTSGVFTVTTSEPHKLQTNDWIRIFSATGGETTRNIQVTVLDSTQFTYTVGSLTATGTLILTPNFVEIENLTTAEFGIWQAQNTTGISTNTENLNDGFIDFKTSIIPTTTAQVSRNRDICFLDNLHTNINTVNEGVVFIEFVKNSSLNGNYDGNPLVFITNSDGVEFASLAGLVINALKQNNNGIERLVGDVLRNSVVTGSVYNLTKMAIKYNSTSIQGFVNGIELPILNFTSSFNTLVKKIELVNGMMLQKLIMYETLTNQECLDITN